MAQQTQIARVVPAYRAFVARYPSVSSLAKSSRADVIRQWSGLGYNRRAVALHEAARAIRAAGRFPRTLEDLRALPGVGPYTAAAVACFAFGAPVVTMDVNVHRVVARAGLGAEPVAANRRAAEAVAALWLAPRRASTFNQALMDLGATICTARAPRCAVCPLRKVCPSAGRAVVREPRRGDRFEGSRRQARGAIVSHLRVHGRADMAALAPFAGSHDLDELLQVLEHDGLVHLRRSRGRIVATMSP